MSLRESLTDRYTIDRELGQGGMATVYLAQDLKHRRKVAIKVMRPDIAASLGASRFLREIEIAANLTHPGIVPVYDSGDADGALYYVMPYIAGESLRARIAREGKLSIADTVRWLREIADALASAHRAGIVHRDIKPENIMISEGHALVMDFGVARATTAASVPGATQAGFVVGTPAYMAPEQAASDPGIDHRADLYALATVGYEMLTGHPPFSGTSSQQILAAQISAKPVDVQQLRRDTPTALGQIIMRGLAKNPVERPTDAAEMIAALEQVSVGQSPAVYPRHLRNAVAAICVLATLAFVAVALLRRGASSRALATAIAVLPFRNVGGDSTQEYFADGMTDEIAGALSRIGGLTVKSHQSTFAFKNRDLAPAAIAGQLGVSRLLQGSVRRGGDRIRIDAELIDPANGSIEWQDHYDQPAGDEFAVQDSIARAIASQLRLTLAAGTDSRPYSTRTRSVAAHDHYLRGMAAFERFDEASLRQGLQEFRAAVAADSSYAAAWAAIGSTYVWLADAYMSPDSAYALAEVNAQRALAIDSLLGGAHMNYGVSLAVFDHDFPRAVAEMERGFALDSSAVDAMTGMAGTLCLMQPGNRAIAVARRLQTVDPLSPVASWMLEACFFMARRYDDAIAQHARTQALAPGFFYDEDWGAASLMEKGDLTGALAAYHATQKVAPIAVYGLGVAYARNHQPDSARAVIASMEEFRKAHYVAPEYIAGVFAAVGEVDSAIAWFRKGIAVRSVGVLTLRTEPRFDGIRRDPKMQALIRELKLP